MKCIPIVASSESTQVLVPTSLAEQCIFQIVQLICRYLIYKSKHRTTKQVWPPCARTQKRFALNPNCCQAKTPCLQNVAPVWHRMMWKYAWMTLAISKDFLLVDACFLWGLPLLKLRAQLLHTDMLCFLLGKNFLWSNHLIVDLAHHQSAGCLQGAPSFLWSSTYSHLFLTPTGPLWSGTLAMDPGWIPCSHHPTSAWIPHYGIYHQISEIWD